MFWTGANGKTLFEELGPDLKHAEHRDLSRDNAVATSVSFRGINQGAPCARGSSPYHLLKQSRARPILATRSLRIPATSRSCRTSVASPFSQRAR
jgi:hypothetical protein